MKLKFGIAWLLATIIFGAGMPRQGPRIIPEKCHFEGEEEP